MRSEGFHSLPTQANHTHQREIIDARQLPVKGINLLTPDHERSPTDVCCAISGIIFGAVLFIVALIAYDHNKLQKINYAADRNGKICRLEMDENQNTYPFVFFNDINDPLSSRYSMSHFKDSV